MVTNLIRRLWKGKRSPAPRGEYPAPRLKHLILFVTDRCNMRCQHCMFWQRVAEPGSEMSLSELQSVAASCPPLQTVGVTGGEPFLRPDLPEIVETFFERNGTFHLQVNTNGLRLDRMVELAERRMCDGHEHFLTFQVSLDGLGETHDRLRASPGSFEKIVSNLRELAKLPEKIPGFRVNVLTNVNATNTTELEPLAELLWDDIGVEHAYDLVRGADFSVWGLPEHLRQPEGPKACDPAPPERLREIAETVRRIDRRENGVMEPFVRQLEVQVGLYEGKPAPFRCLSAGRTTGVVYSDGSVTACEFTPPFAQLAEFNYDFEALWTSPAAEARRREITTCSCAHSCFVLTSMLEWEEQQG